jgi:hypothetical protein
MKASVRLLVPLGIVGVLCAVLSGPVSFRDVIFFRQRLEARRVRKQCDAFALQRWATNLLALHGRDQEPYYDPRGTNLPGDILAVYSWPPAVVGGRDSVSVVWGRGHPVIHVGGSDFVLTNRLAARWIPDVYVISSK